MNTLVEISPLTLSVKSQYGKSVLIERKNIRALSTETSFLYIHTKDSHLPLAIDLDSTEDAEFVLKLYRKRILEEAIS